MPFLRRGRRRRLRRLFLLGGAIAGVAAWRNREVNRNLARSDVRAPR